MDERTRRAVLDVLGRHARAEGRTEVFSLLGLDWDLLPGVFSPVQTATTELYSTWMPYLAGGSFLDIGCGAGVISVVAALRGARVTALDISAAAVDNTRRNAERHGVADRVRTLRSDVYAGLDPDARFDLIFWNSSYAEAPDDYVYETDLHRAFFDAGYRSHRAYVGGARAHLVPGGRVLLGFGEIGNRRLLDRLAADAGMVVRLLRHAARTTTVAVDCQLLELATGQVEGAEFDGGSCRPGLV
jgi:release factor glutamine methyltransferase